MSRSVLLIEDDPQTRSLLEHFCHTRAWRAVAVAEGRLALEAYERERPDVVLLDLELPGVPGLQLLDIIRQRDPDSTVLILTGHADVATAVEAMRLGAENFLTKPVDFALLEVACVRAFEKADLRRHNRFYTERQGGTMDAFSLGDTPEVRGIVQQIDRLAAGNAPVLLTGETGTGKGYVAKLLHARSPRADAPFIDVNCAGLSATFLDSELFGHERGAFTDAKTQKAGLFEVANGGTLFLDEIGDLATELQPKLLKALESQRFRRIGGTREIEVDVRLIAATHHDLAAAVRSGRFREDLYYRLAVLPLHLPPLRERGRELIVELSHRLLADLQRRLGQGPTRISAAALSLIVEHSWPGNIRELRNMLERVLLLAPHESEIRPEHLPAELRARATLPAEQSQGDLSLLAAERRHIEAVLVQFGGNRARAARALGITRATLYRKLRA